MNQQQQALLSAWQSRTQPAVFAQFSLQARQRIATTFLKVASFSGDQKVDGGQRAELEEWCTEIAELGAEDALTAPEFIAELRNCQLSLFDNITSNALDAGRQHSDSERIDLLQSVANLLLRLDGLIGQSAEKFGAMHKSSGTAKPAPDQHGPPGKTLQHEIRTPLQGALLTTELMLEDAGNGDLVSADDILAVRNSIETAVGILNDFAGRSVPG